MPEITQLLRALVQFTAIIFPHADPGAYPTHPTETDPLQCLSELYTLLCRVLNQATSVLIEKSATGQVSIQRLIAAITQSALRPTPTPNRASTDLERLLLRSAWLLLAHAAGRDVDPVETYLSLLRLYPVLAQMLDEARSTYIPAGDADVLMVDANSFPQVGGVPGVNAPFHGALPLPTQWSFHPAAQHIPRIPPDPSSFQALSQFPTNHVPWPQPTPDHFAFAFHRYLELERARSMMAPLFNRPDVSLLQKHSSFLSLTSH
ncbi:hypothetical protein H0H81_008021 [Sphagnurus paluster]|uniref:Uncharacterized protein n=1 Tax=Sphagnurus paluster TaxID=117069 RepID=A0A9P7KLI4_9AGAR|nr:hypothetical protein H0H81_008021 [Sphagnurus paluster]